MKNLFFLLCLLAFDHQSFGQGENNNWYFGVDAGLNFISNTTTVLLNNTSGANNYTGNGSISDKVSGAMQFYTDAKSVWNANFQKMLAGVIPPNQPPNLIDSPGGYENGMIVPSISNRNQFYIFSQGRWNTQINNSKLVYSIIDMSLNNGLGDIVPNQIGINLLDENNNPFAQYPSGGAFTIVPNNSGNAYWVLYPYFNNKLYAYKIDASGIHSPVVSNLTFSNLNVVNVYLSAIKVSPSYAKIAISTSTAATIESNGEMRIYDFNNTNGTIDTTNEIRINGLSIRSLEFSPNSNLLFYTSHIDYNNCFNCIDTRIDSYNMTTNSSNLISSAYGVIYQNLQRTPNNEIIFSRNTRYLSRLTNPNNPITTVDFDNYDLNPDWPNITRLVGPLPQLIPPLSCALYEDLRGNNIAGNYSYQVSDHITTSHDYTINNAQNINLYASNYVELTQNSHFKSGSNMLAKIQACPASRQTNTEVNSVSATKTIIPDVQMIVYPNPSQDSFTVHLNGALMSSMSVSSIADGRIIYQQEKLDENSLLVDSSQWKQGIYIVSVKTSSGQAFTEKWVKR